MSPNETQKNLWDTTKEKARKVAAGTVIMLGAIGITSCSSNTEAQPQPDETTQVAEPTESPTPSPSESETTDPSETPSPSPSETSSPTPEATPSGITVDYGSFANWDQKVITGDPRQEHRAEGTKLYTCDQFFIANGLPGLEESEPQRDWTMERIVDYNAPRLQLAWELNMDTTDERNGEVALNILECLTTPSGSTTNDAFSMLSNTFQTYRGNSIEAINPLPFTIESDNLTRESSGRFYDPGLGTDISIGEFVNNNGIRDVYSQVTFAQAPTRNYRLATIHLANEDLYWGANDIVVHDESRTGAPGRTGGSNR